MKLPKTHDRRPHHASPGRARPRFHASASASTSILPPVPEPTDGACAHGAVIEVLAALDGVPRALVGEDFGGAFVAERAMQAGRALAALASCLDEDQRVVVDYALGGPEALESVRAQLEAWSAAASATLHAAPWSRTPRQLCVWWKGVRGRLLDAVWTVCLELDYADELTWRIAEELTCTGASARAERLFVRSVLARWLFVGRDREVFDRLGLVITSIESGLGGPVTTVLRPPSRWLLTALLARLVVERQAQEYVERIEPAVFEELSQEVRTALRSMAAASPHPEWSSTVLRLDVDAA